MVSGRHGFTAHMWFLLKKKGEKGVEGWSDQITDWGCRHYICPLWQHQLKVVQHGMLFLIFCMYLLLLKEYSYCAIVLYRPATNMEIGWYHCSAHTVILEYTTVEYLKRRGGWLQTSTVGRIRCRLYHSPTLWPKHRKLYISHIN